MASPEDCNPSTPDANKFYSPTKQSRDLHTQASSVTMGANMQPDMTQHYGCQLLPDIANSVAKSPVKKPVISYQAKVHTDIAHSQDPITDEEKARQAARLGTINQPPPFSLPEQDTHAPGAFSSSDSHFDMPSTAAEDTQLEAELEDIRRQQSGSTGPAPNIESQNLDAIHTGMEDAARAAADTTTEDKDLPATVTTRRRPRHTEVMSGAELDDNAYPMWIQLTEDHTDGTSEEVIRVNSMEEFCNSIRQHPNVWYTWIGRFFSRHKDVTVDYDSLQAMYESLQAQCKEAEDMRDLRQQDAEDLRAQLIEANSQLATAQLLNTKAAEAIDSWKAQNGKLRSDRDEWVHQFRLKDSENQRLKGELAAAAARAPAAYPPHQNGPINYYAEPQSFNRNLGQQSYVPAYHQPVPPRAPQQHNPTNNPYVCAHMAPGNEGGGYATPPWQVNGSGGGGGRGDGGGRADGDGYRLKYSPGHTFPPQQQFPSRNMDGYGIKVSKFSGKPDENFDAWRMAIQSALRSCQWSSIQSKIDFIRNSLDGNAFHNIAQRADPDDSNLRPYESEHEMMRELQTIYNGADRQAQATVDLQKPAAYQQFTEKYTDFLSRTLGKLRLLQYPESLMITELKRLMIPHLRRGMQGTLHPTIHAFNEAVLRYENDREFSAVYDNRFKSQPATSGKPAYSSDNNIRSGNTAYKPRGAPTLAERRKRGKSLLEEFDRTPADMDKLRERRLCLKCGSKEHRFANCTERNHRPSIKIEGLRAATIYERDEFDTPEDPIFEQIEYNDLPDVMSDDEEENA